MILFSDVRIIFCNSISGVVRVAVSATPGKTKHFQTLVVSDSLLLCDCPGTNHSSVQ